MKDNKLAKQLIDRGLAVVSEQDLLVNQDFLDAFNTHLGLRLAEELGDKVDEFNQLPDDEDQRISWLQQQLPNLGEIAQDECSKLAKEISDDSDEVMKLMNEM